MSTHEVYNLPPKYRGLVFVSPSEPAMVADITTPLPVEGSVIVKPLYSWVAAYTKDVFTGGNPRNYPYPLPIVPGNFSIGRVAAVANDASKLMPEQLVFTEPMIRARDDPETTTILHGFHMGFTPATHKLASETWRNSSWGELVKVPLENVYPIDEVAIGRLNYSLEDLGYLAQAVIPFGGLHDVSLRAGETIIIAPATGNFGGAAVRIALALGARVIAMGRNITILESLRSLGEPGRIETVQISGDVETDKKSLAQFGPADVYMDISPPAAGDSSHIRAGFGALRRGGRVSLMGGIRGNLEIPYYPSVMKGLTIKATFMYTRQQVKEIIKMVEHGMLKLGPKAGLETVGTYQLEQWEEAFEIAHEEAGAGRSVYFTPNVE